MFKWIVSLIALSFFSCSITDKNKREFISTKFIDDLNQYKLEQKFNSPNNKDFIGIYYDETRSLSGIKILKLYSGDSSSVAELYFGAHPLEISNWVDTFIVMNAGVFSAHGDSTYRKIYLDGSVDKNKSIGKYQIEYKKNYNFKTK
jgi:hypothetical protein